MINFGQNAETGGNSFLAQSKEINYLQEGCPKDSGEEVLRTSRNFFSNFVI